MDLNVIKTNLCDTKKRNGEQDSCCHPLVCRFQLSDAVPAVSQSLCAERFNGS